MRPHLITAGISLAVCGTWHFLGWGYNKANAWWQHRGTKRGKTGKAETQTAKA